MVVRNSKVPEYFSWFIKASAITIFGFIFIKKGYDSKRLINHESIHVEQYKETLFIGFLLIYALHWLMNVLIYRNLDEAYYNIILEREAYANEYDLGYLKTRKRFSWLKYWRKND